MWMTMVYLTEVWKLNFTHAAAIVNLFWGIVAILPVGLQFLVDAFMGNYWMVLVSSFAYSAGLGFLSMSTPPVLARATGTYSAYEPECIGQGQKILFYTAIVLIAVGMSGHLTSLGAFIAEQFMDSQSDLEDSMPCHFFLSFLMVILIPIAGVFAIYYIKPWSIRYGIPAICTLVATLIFLTGSCSYHTHRAQGSPLTTLFRVFVASASKIFRRCPRDASQLYERRDDGYQISHTPCLRCLDKAAIILATQPLEQQQNSTKDVMMVIRYLILLASDKAAIILATQPLEQQQNNRWRLCRVTEVEETKSILCMIPICTIFILMGVVSSIGNTYFIEQATHMNHKVGRIKVPLPILLWFYDHAKQQFAKIYFQIGGLTRYGPPIGIAVSMIFAILCCITAAKVETRRLGAVNSHGLIDKREETIPISIVWLLPQFLLLGGLDGIADNSIGWFFINQVPPSMARYMVLFAIAVFGMGIMGSVF
ncbi:protein NRT1/ PTR FAMILY 5.5-like [Prunus avium]|uniref:Protein NRT1/ PTR FAMILY 5.5-like n=1 Tax=Prunus avium TaxID=42229 RepID=A0A6P5TPF7_PRUAV|nr:protein NRT1/ PTR FAMILY 5.5-like [Prunus avium]